MYTLLDSCLDRLDIFEFLNHVEDGLKDHYDIKMLTYLMLVRLAHLCPSAVLQSKSVAQKLITKLSGAKRSPGNPNVMLLSVVIWQNKKGKVFTVLMQF